MTTSTLLSSLAKLADKQAQPVKLNKTFNEALNHKIEAPKQPAIERSRIEPTPSIDKNEHEKFSLYCEQIDRLKSELNLDLQEILYRAIGLMYDAEINN